MTSPTNTTKPGPYYGWYVVAAATFVVLVTIGARNAFGVFVIPMSDEFGWNRFTVSLAAALGGLVNGLVQPFAGRIFDRTGGRNFILLSLMVVGLATILLSLTFHFLFLVFMFGVVASMAISGSSVTNTAALVARWFRRKRGTALAINASGMSMGGLIMVPFAMYLVQTANWRVAWVGLGLVVLVAVPLAFMFIHENPAKRGLQPDGDPEPADDDPREVNGSQRGPLEVDRWADSFRSLPIWKMSVSYLICGSTTYLLTIHFVPYAIDRGVSPGLAAIIFGLMAGLNVIGAIGAGMISDRFNRKDILGLVYFVRGGAYMVLVIPPMLGVPVLSGDLGLWLFASIAGFSWIATAPLTTTLTADVYGLRTLGTIAGVTFVFHQVGGFSAVLLAGLLYDVTGSYTIPFLLFGSLLFPAGISAFSIKERQYSTRFMHRPLPAAYGGA